MNQYEIDLQVEVSISEAITERLRETAAAVLIHGEIAPPGGLTILITGDDQIQQLNREFLGYDQATDVLSFPAGDRMPGMSPYMGDIAISVPFAERQARAGGHSLLAELQLLVVHGVLHLLGYDHAEPEDRAEMWRVQAAILGEQKAEIIAPADEI
jgi:probable rRNA maturation factor